MTEKHQKDDGKKTKKPDLSRLSDKHLEELARAVKAEQSIRTKEKAKKPSEMSDKEFENYKAKMFSKDEDE